MKIATIIIRILLGGLFTFSALNFFFGLGEPPKFEGGALTFMQGLGSSGYFMVLVKVVELVCGIAILSGQFLPLASVILMPVTLNILLFHSFLHPEGLLIAVLLFAFNAYMLYSQKHRLTPVLARR